MTTMRSAEQATPHGSINACIRPKNLYDCYLLTFCLLSSINLIVQLAKTLYIDWSIETLGLLISIPTISLEP